MAEITLIPLLHPSIRMPIKMRNMKISFKVRPTQVLGALMDDVEEFLDCLLAATGYAVEFSYNVMWNAKDVKKGLSPRSLIGDHFIDGDIFGVYGDITPKGSPKNREKVEASVVPHAVLVGSDKTTLLNYMESEQDDNDCAVIENEFGEDPIEVQ
jgi:hypothetical protein